ncbi:PaaI family thioesterase [Comamonas faecalis]|uniref:Medium/long-chain acyl-CoA thioesterase YigI n=1 Tax=Comamonas faecalis TaxID=1387849 RepID=A0ABP7RQG2_9BURK
MAQEESTGAPLAFGAHIPFVHELGVELLRMEGGESTLCYRTQPQHTNSFAVAHGGVSMTLLDVAMAVAARSDTPELGVVTIEMKASFMRPARGVLTARGRRLHRTRSMAFAEASIFDEDGQICGHATGTFRYVPKADPAKSVATD